MLNEGNQIHNFISSSGSGTVINYGSGSDFLTSYSSGSGSTSQKIMVPTVPVPVPVPQHCPVHNAFDAGKSKTTFFGPKWHSPNGSMPFHRAKKKSPFPGPKILPPAQVMDLPASKALQGRINQRSIGSFMYMSFYILCSVFCSVPVCCEFYVHEFQDPPFPMALPPLSVWVGGGGGQCSKFFLSHCPLPTSKQP
jgi:hypothetical protein